MNVADAINKGQQIHKTARQVYMEKQLSRPVSVTGILQFMQEQMTINGYGPMAPINKANTKKIFGFIKFLKNAGYTDPEIYGFVKDCVENWATISQIKIFTDGRKSYTLDVVPNIVDIIICKTQIFNEINKKEAGIDLDEESLWELWGKA